MSTAQPGNPKNLAYYCELFDKLNVSNTERGKAPYKPILLLSVIDLIAQGLINNHEIYITKELIDTFNKYRRILSPDKKFDSSLSLPFFHLKNEDIKFWYLDFKNEIYDGSTQTNEKIRKSIKQLEKYVNKAYIDRDLFNLIQDEDSRQELVDTLVSKWFSLSEGTTENLLKANQAFQTSIQKEIEKLGESEDPKFYFRKSAARNPIFGKAVAGIYDYRCAFCRLKVNNSLNPLTQSIVEGAHIKPFSIFFNNEISNGISLCKNHHWAFDKGLFTIDNQYKIIVSRHLQEDSPNAKRKMQDFQGESIVLPDSKKYAPDKCYPNPDALKWHRENRFKG